MLYAQSAHLARQTRQARGESRRDKFAARAQTHHKKTILIQEKCYAELTAATLALALAFEPKVQQCFCGSWGGFP